MVILVYINMLGDGLTNIACYMIVVHITGWYMFIHDNINRIYICTAIIRDIAVHMYIKGDK